MNKIILLLSFIISILSLNGMQYQKYPDIKTSLICILKQMIDSNEGLFNDKQKFTLEELRFIQHNIDFLCTLPYPMPPSHLSKRAYLLQLTTIKDIACTLTFQEEIREACALGKTIFTRVEKLYKKGKVSKKNYDKIMDHSAQLN